LNVHFSSQHANWRTPEGIYNQLNEEFGFNFDPCPLYGEFYAEQNGAVDGLKVNWGYTTFCNPPYGKEISKWTAKAREEAEKNKTVVLLVPSRTDTAWWHDDIMKADEIRFIRGRLKFGGATSDAPFPSAVVIWRKED